MSLKQNFCVQIRMIMKQNEAISPPQSSLQMLLNITLWENGSLVTCSGPLYNNLAVVHVGVLAERQKHIRRLI